MRAAFITRLPLPGGEELGCAAVEVRCAWSRVCCISQPLHAYSAKTHLFPTAVGGKSSKKSGSAPPTGSPAEATVVSAEGGAGKDDGAGASQAAS